MTIFLRLIAMLLIPLKLVLIFPMLVFVFPIYWVVTGRDPFMELDPDAYFSWPGQSEGGY